MHHYVCVYFNYIGYNTRFKLTTEFLERYPNVHCIEVAYGVAPFVIERENTSRVRFEHFTGFPVYKVLNAYIRQNIEEMESITLLDSDLILPQDFFESVEDKLSDCVDVPTFIQPFELAFDNSPDSKVIFIPRVGAACSKSVNNSHTGYIYTWNRKFIDKLGVCLFPESMVYGGFDHLFYLCLFGELEVIESIIPNKLITDEWVRFYRRVYGCKYDYINFMIYHEYHGEKSNRYTDRWERYRKCTYSDLLDYFKGRKEDDKVFV